MSENTDRDGLRLSAESPWPGLSPFDEKSGSFFVGRKGETDELFRMVRRESLTLFFGKSGLGKTSLLHAALFQRLLNVGLLPVVVRLDYRSAVLSPLDQMKALLVRAVAEAGIGVRPPAPDESLWAYCHHNDTAIFNERPLVLIFDQFEEYFTLGGRSAAAEAFLKELAGLVTNTPPPELSQVFATQAARVKEYDFHCQPCRVVISLREDFLPDMETVKEKLPYLFENKLRLEPMKRSQALEVILKPGGHLVSEEVAEKIVDFVATGAPGKRTADGIEPLLLSAVLYELNDRRRREGRGAITADLLEGESSASILEGFYRKAMEGLPERVHAFVEEELLTFDGRRNSVNEGQAKHKHGLEQAEIEGLIVRHLVRREERPAGTLLELVHDRLCPVVAESRRRRQEQARRRQELDRQNRRARRIKILAASLAGVCLLMGIEIAYVRRQKSEALAARQRSEQYQEIAAALAESTIPLFDQVRFIGDRRTIRQNMEAILANCTRFPSNDPGFRLTRIAGEMLVRLGEVSRSGGRNDDALRELQQAADIYRQLATQDPTNGLHRSGLAQALRGLGAVQANRGDSEQALRLLEESLQIQEQLLAGDEGNLRWNRGVFFTLRTMDEVFKAKGDTTSARKYYVAQLDRVRRLCEAQPQDSQRQVQLASACVSLGGALRDQARFEEAYGYFTNGLGICRGIMEREPTNTFVRYSLSSAWSGLGDVAKARGDLEEAHAACSNALAIYEALSERDRVNTFWQRRRADCYARLGDVLQARGQPEKACDAFQKGVETAERLLRQDEGNVQWRQALAVCASGFGGLLRAQGRAEESLRWHRKALEMRESLARLDRKSSQWFSDFNAAATGVAEVVAGLAASAPADEAVRIDYAHAAAHIAFCGMLQGSGPDARALSLAALQAAPREARPRIVYAHGCLLEGRYEEARDAFAAVCREALVPEDLFAVIVDDLDWIRERGTASPQSDRMKKELKQILASGRLARNP